MARVTSLASAGLVSAAALTDNCGPSRQQVGEAVIIAWPLVVFGVLVVQRGLLTLWRKKWPAVRTPWVAPVLLLAVATSMSLGMIVHVDKPMQWAGMALWLFGCSYAAVVLLTTRVWLFFDVRYAFMGPQLVAALVFVLPAVLIAALPGPAHTDLEGLYILPGMGGWVPGGLLIATYAEALIRTRRRE